jgi:chemotaxis protein MotB
MRHLVTHSRQPRSNVHQLARIAPRWISLALWTSLVLGFGCVTAGQHEEVVTERDRLAVEANQLNERVRVLESSNKSLDKERVQLMEQTEDLREVRAALEKDVTRLTKAESELATTRAKLDVQSEEVTKLRATYSGLVEELEAEVASGQIEIEQLREGLRVNVSDEILFASGSAELGNNGVAVLKRVASQLQSIPQRVEVQGHTDNIAIRGALTKRFPTNWELAAARASRVVRLLQREGINPSRLTAVSYAEHRPVASNDTDDDRRLNRRIELRLLPPEPTAPPSSQPESAAP